MRATAFPLSRCAIDLEGSSVGDHAVSVQSPLSVGLFAGKWCSYAESTDLPTDQRLEDGGSLVFDTPPLSEDIEILGAPSVELALTVDRPQAMIAVRLADVGRSDSVTLVSFGLLNLSHRDSDEQPEPLEPGRRYRVTVPLNHVAQRFPAGNRIRVAVSTSYWPLAWPAPEPARLTLFTGESRLNLPVRSPRREDAELPDLGEPRCAAGPEVTVLRPAHREWTVQFNLATNEAVLHVIDHDVWRRLEASGLELRYDVNEAYRYANDDYASLRGEVTATRCIGRDGWRTRVETRTVLTSDPTHFRVRATLDAYEGDTRVFAGSWDERIPRDRM